MDYFEKKKVEDKIKSDINDIKEFDEVEHFIDANFQQFLRNGEYDDNSMDLSYHYKMLKEIEFFRANIYGIKPDLEKQEPQCVVTHKIRNTDGPMQGNNMLEPV